MMRHSLVQGWQWEGRGHPGYGELRSGSLSRSQPKYISYLKALRAPIFCGHNNTQNGALRDPPVPIAASFAPFLIEWYREKIREKNQVEESNVDVVPLGGFCSFCSTNDDICHSPRLFTFMIKIFNPWTIWTPDILKRNVVYSDSSV